mmetsp:Transcript_30916/g.69455  ORF Transcript_30916/g.69455 Transcript_30916/m.69455 type:complete len:89 (+) Transcript_30916:198-464(+)
MPSWRTAQAAALLSPVIGTVLFNSLPTPSVPANHLRQTSGSHQGKKQAEQIQEILKQLPKKSSAEKIEAAYDGALRTHSIGFPSTKSQ